MQFSRCDALTTGAVILLLFLWEAARPVRTGAPASGPLPKVSADNAGAGNRCPVASAESVNRALAAENAELRRRLAEVQYAEQRCLRTPSPSTSSPAPSPGQSTPLANLTILNSSMQPVVGTSPPKPSTSPPAQLPVFMHSYPLSDDDGYLLEPAGCTGDRKVELVARSESGKYPAPQFMPQSPTGDLRQQELPNAFCIGEILDWLSRSDHNHLESVGWSRPSYIMGAVIVTNGRGDVWVQRNGQGEFRGVDRVATMAKYARYLNRTTIFLLTINDIDVWSFIHPKRADALRDLMQRCPLFYVHWNPAVDVKTGRLPTRTIMIPDPYPFNWQLQPPKLPKTGDRAGKIVWRGATLGQYPPGNYAASDRYKAVKALNGASFGDCAFAQYCNGVEKPQAPWSAGGLSIDDQAAYGAVLDVDGNAATWAGMRWKLGRGCAVFKARSSLGWLQWYYPLLEHKVHVWMFDPNKPEDAIRSEAAGLLGAKDPDGRLVVERLGEAAHAFAKTHFTEAAVERAIREAIVGAWDNATWREQMDWRIRGASWV